jgi:trk system potassium uptake protein TrkH
MLKHRLIPFASLPQILLLAGFAGVIGAGTGLLLLPWSQTAGEVGWVDALFTSASAVCVTGLVVVDTGTAFSFFGQVVILFLIQIGGLGIMTFAALAYLVLGRRLSLASQAALHDTFFQRDLGIEFKKRFFQILLITGSIEFLGACCIFLALLTRGTPFPEAVFSSVFHAVSAFCNAGFSIYRDNLVSLRDSPTIMAAIMSLIVLGGLGHMVLHEVLGSFTRRLLRREGSSHPRRLTVHSRVVLRVTLGLIVGGTLGLLFLGLTKDEPTWGLKVSSALFQSVTARTAGFNTVDIGILPVSSLLLITLLMFIGGSPGSCAGGVKTTALAISLAEMRAKLRGEEDVVMMERRVPAPVVARTMVLIRLAILWNLFGLFFLLCTEPGRTFHELLFEQISAFGTVGLSTGITDKLSSAGKLWITSTMYLGRVGPLTIALGLLPTRPVRVKYPEARILIG